MTSDMLSQDEIDALLKKDDTENPHTQEEISIGDYISESEQDTLGEIGNITFGSSSTALSRLLNQKVEITTPKLSIVRREELANEFPKPHVAIHVSYTEGFKGINLFVIDKQDASIIADLMLGGDGEPEEDELNDMHLSAVQEAMNQMMGSASTSMSSIFNRRIDISPPSIDIMDLAENSSEEFIDEEVLITVSFRMKIGELIDSNIMQLVPVSFAKEMVQMLNPGEDSESIPTQAEEDTEKEQSYPQASQAQQKEESHPQHQTSYNQQQQAYNQQQAQPPRQGNAQESWSQHSSTQQGSYGQGAINRSEHVQPVQFSNFEQNSIANDQVKNLDLLMDIPIQVTVELGRTKRRIKDILELSPGSILELDKLAGEPVDILVNNKLVAKGEVVVIEENFGVRVTDILSQWDRLQKLQ